MIVAVVTALCAVPADAPAKGQTIHVPAVPKKLPEPTAVMPFVNRSGVSGLDWMQPAVPFLLAEKLDGHRRLRPAYGPTVVPDRQPVTEDPADIARFAAEVGAKWVWTGWFRRPNWDLQLSISLWKVTGTESTRVGRVVARGEFAEVHDMATKAIVELCETAGIPVAEADQAEVGRAATKDFYALTLFGRGLVAYLGVGGQKDLERAKKDLERAVFIDPEMLMGQRVVAEFYLGSGMLLKARNRLQFALEKRPDYAAAIEALARVEHARRQPKVARNLYVELLRKRPSDLEARFLLGQVLWETNEVDEAYEQLKQVVPHRPKDVRVRRALVLIHSSRGDNESLVEELEKVAELDPGDVATRLDLGAAYAALEKYDKAIEAYESVVAANPKHIQALKFLGDLYKTQGKLGRAIQYYGLALKAKPEDPRAYFLLGAAYVQAGDDAQAKRIYRQAQRFKRFRPEVFNNLGAIAYREGNLNESLWYLRRAVLKRPRKARYRYNYALSLSAASETTEALAQIDAGLDIEPEHVQLRYMRGVVLLREGKVPAAREEFERTLRVQPDHEGARHNLAMLDELDRRAREGEVVVEGR